MYEPVAGKHAKLELIFFPGSFKEDSYKTTWMTEDNKHCWLQSWLPDAFPESRIFAVSYRVDLFLLCKTLIAELIRSRKGTGLPLMLIGHCLGGIVIKVLCNQVEQEISMKDGKHDQGSYREPLRSIRGVGYYATSHFSHCSCYGGGNKIIFSKAGDCDLARINADYSYNVANLGWKELALGETRPTEQGSIVLVDESSASHGIQRNSFFPVAADHFSICKPKSPSSNSFQYLVRFIQTTMNEVIIESFRLDEKAQYRNMNVRRKKRRGIALVINMEKETPGSIADWRRLEVMADYLRLKPLIVSDVGARSIPLVIQEIFEKEKKAMEDDECILVCVNAHGAVSADGIRDNKGNGILKPIADCPVLDGKPKVFVVNSCRGINGEIDATIGLLQDQNELQGVDDCLLMYSTKLDTTESWRQETGHEQGTLFVFELTEHISLLYQTTDVQDIFKLVEDKVSKLARRYGVEQSSVMFSTLKKRLSWRRGEACPSDCITTQDCVRMASQYAELLSIGRSCGGRSCW